MPRYFFHRIDGTSDLDNNGLELPDLDHARQEAITFAADTLKSRSNSLWNGGDVRIEVANGDHELIFAVVISVVDGIERFSVQ